MSDSSEPKPNLDLSQLRLMPQWVAEFGKTASSPAADYPEERPRDRGDRRGGFGGGQDQRRSFGGGGGRSDGPPRGDRKPFDKPRGPSTGPSDRGPRPQGDRRDDRRGGAGGGGNSRQDRDRQHGQGRGGRDDRGGGRPVYEQAPAPVAGLTVVVEPEAKATEAMASMIRTAGKAYSVFDAARLVLASGDRFHVKFKLAPDAGAKLYSVPTDGSLWLSREDAMAHVMHGEAINSFYKVEEIELEAPKGNFNSVAVCGMSGEMLGPPSHHSYQATLHKLHRERFSHLHFEDYKRRVRTDSSPEAVEKWKDSQKHGTQWTYLKGEVAEGEEPKTFKSRAEMEAHFRATHADTLVGEVTDATVSGNIPKRLLAPSLYNHLRRAVDDARKHLLATAQMLCSGFERVGLKLFKRRGGKLWVSRTRPRLLESTVVLSDRISRMVEVIKNQPGIQVKKLVETVAPSPEGTSTAPTAKAEKPVGPAPAPVEESLPAPQPVENATEAEDSAIEGIAIDGSGAPKTDEAPGTEEVTAAESPAPAPAPAPVAPAAALPTAAPTPQHEWTADQLHALQDLHWLNSEGYVIEYADGIVFPGVTEPPPPKPKAELPPKEKAEGKKATAAEAPTQDASPSEEPSSGADETSRSEEAASPASNEEVAPEVTSTAPDAAEAADEVASTEVAEEESPSSEAPTTVDEQTPADEAMSEEIAESADEAVESESTSTTVSEEAEEPADASPSSEETSSKAE